MGFWDRFKPGSNTPEPANPEAAPSKPKADFGDVLARQMQRGGDPNMRQIPTREYTGAENLEYEKARRTRLSARVRERIGDHTESLEALKREMTKWSMMSDRDVAAHIAGLTHVGAPQSIETYRSQRVMRAAETLRDAERVILSLNLVSEALDATNNDPQAAMKEIDTRVASVVEALQEAQRLGKPENIQQALWNKHARLRAAGEALRTEYKGIWNLP